MNQLISHLAPLPVHARQSLTLDRGLEFVSWRELEKGMGTAAWFCDPQAPWQKGTVENANKRVRRYVLPQTVVLDVTNQDIRSRCERLNATRSRVVYGLALRQTQGLMRSVAALMGFDIAVPDFSTLSRRSKGLALPSIKSRTKTSGPVHLVVDSTGLKVFGEGEWLENKHKTKPKPKRWRKLHLGLDLVSGEIVCSDLTADDVGDPTALPGLLDQIGGAPDKFIADGAYDGAPTRDLLAERFGEIVEVIIPPPKTAVPSPQSVLPHLVGTAILQKSTGYNKRSRVETQMGRWKAVIGPSLKARHFDNQKTEAKIGVRVLNRMTELGRPECKRVA